MIKLAFLASNYGTSLRAIVAACEAGALDAKPVLIVSNRQDAPALAFANESGIRAKVIPTKADPAEADRRLAAALHSADADLVILSGYLRKLGQVTLRLFQGRILNIHPALLPRHGGEGMYGRRVHEAVIRSGDRESGATVHMVDAEYDHGRIIAQSRIEVESGETPESLGAKVMALEPPLFVETLARISRGELEVGK